MTKGVLIYRASSEYDDDPTSRYQFPTKLYLSRAKKLIGDWVIYLEPRRGGRRGYFAAARAQALEADPNDRTRHLILIEPGSYIEFDNHVPFSDQHGPLERALANAQGGQSGRKQSAIRAISDADFNRIIERGLSGESDFLPRVDQPPTDHTDNRVFEDRATFTYEVERVRVDLLMSRVVRDRTFRRNVLAAYDARCAVSGLKLLNGGGRAEVEAAHIKPVLHGGPDAVANGLALSGTAHWMFDRGLISIDDDLTIQISRHVNDIDSILGFVVPDRMVRAPSNPVHRPHPRFLRWHRENVFKH